MNRILWIRKVGGRRIGLILNGIGIGIGIRDGCLRY
jgi:hypothetical protein